MKIVRNYKFKTPEKDYEVTQDSLYLLVNVLDDNHIDYEYKELCVYAVDAETCEDVNIRNVTIILEKGVITRLMHLI